MNIKPYLLLLSVCTLLPSCKAQQLQTDIPKVENHLKGELDYTQEPLNLVQMQANGEEIKLGKINTDGTVYFNPPEFNIKALYDSIPLQHYKFHSLFLMNSSCKDRDVFAKTPFDDVYAQKYDPIHIKKYGKNVAVLYPVTDKKLISNNRYASDSLTTSSSYFWLYMDRSITFTDECIKSSFKGYYDIEVAITANIQLKKGWNFIREHFVMVQDYSRDDYHTILPKEIRFTQSSPASKEIKWFIKQTMDDDKIASAKKLYELEPISKKQFTTWLPEKAGDFKRTSYKLDKALERNSSKTNNVFLVFENGNQKMEIAVIDGAKSPEDLEMVRFAFSMDENFERDDKPTSDTTASNEVHHISKEDKNSNTTQILSVFKDRIVLQAKGENMTAVQLWEGIKALDIASIIK